MTDSVDQPLETDIEGIIRRIRDPLTPVEEQQQWIAFLKALRECARRGEGPAEDATSKAIRVIVRSDLSEDKKRQIIEQLAADAESAIHQHTDDLVTEAERFLRNGHRGGSGSS
jgi:hypothetical protein